MCACMDDVRAYSPCACMPSDVSNVPAPAPPDTQKYIAPHQRDVTQILAALVHVGWAGLGWATSLGHSTSCHSSMVSPRLPTPCASVPATACPQSPAPLSSLIFSRSLQACHELVPPETLEPVLRQLVDQFVHDRWARRAVCA